MVLKGFFNVEVCNPLESSIFGVRTVFGRDAFHIFSQGLQAVIPLIEGVIALAVTRASTGCWTESPFCSVVVPALSWDSLIPGVGTKVPRSGSKPWYEKGVAGALPLGKMPLHVLPQELSTRTCDAAHHSVMLSATQCAHPQRPPLQVP